MMFLFWTKEVFFALISTIIIGFAFSILIYQFFRTRFKHVLFLAFTCFFLMMFIMFSMIAHLTLSSSWIGMANCFHILILAFLILLIDSISRENMDPLKILILGMISTAIFLTTLEPKISDYHIWSNGNISLFLDGNFLISVATAIIIECIGFIYFMAKIYWNSPKKLKYYALISFIGAIILAPVSGVLYFLGIMWNYFPGIQFISMAIGAMLYSFAFKQQPKLAFILPFSRIQHIYFIMPNGVCIYNQAFRAKKDVSAELVGGGITGLSALIQEFTQTKSNIKIIGQENMLILLEQGKFVNAALITEKNHIFLRSNLKRLIQEVEKSFREKLESYHGEISQFSTIGKFVNKIFVN
ncbi:MAG: hypothetical protein HWN67_15390 [Candidatus Helarchaeota archaeon]|nr:hypothetical protein [Candidatus Helarchaeota archaeon]